MRKVLLLMLLVVLPLSARAAEPVLVIHGGAGTITRASMTPEREAEYRAALDQALKIGYAILDKGGSSLDAVEATVRFMEDSPLFNAGKGAVFTHEGRNELDASIMDGRTRLAGAVAAVTIIKNPISAARAVMEKSEHVMLVGRGAELFATEQGLEVVDPSYFWTERRWKDLQKELLKEKQTANPDNKHGTVGAVALDRNGNLAAATSTGGRTNKKFGRVGDTPVIGAGTFADNATCAVSGTGHGEFFIRWAVAHEIAALMRYKGLSVAAAADEVINKQLKNVKGEGGVIALDAKGNFAMPFNSDGMYRGWMKGGKSTVMIYKD
jgi:L-asparaginase / beta-aspartyl-peptidase